MISRTETYSPFQPNFPSNMNAVTLKPGDGPAVTVYVPYSGRCSIVCSVNPVGWIDAVGISPASAYAAWLAAYFFGLQDLGPYLRSIHPNIPIAVKEYIYSKAYSRNAAGKFPAIWNGLGAHGKNGEWAYWIDDRTWVPERPQIPRRTGKTNISSSQVNS